MSGKEEEEHNPDILTIIIRNHNQDDETFFKIKKTTKMQKIFEKYAASKNLDINSLRFLLDGDRIDKESTAKMLEMEDRDQIDCVLAQTGGCAAR